MKCDVIAAIRGLQFTEDTDTEEIETITPAEYYFRNGSHYLMYDELDEDSGETTKNILKFKDRTMELTKKGLINVHMVFEEHKKNMTNYGTPFGNILIGIDASKVCMEQEENRMRFEVKYTLDVNYEQIADCKILIDICSREEGSTLIKKEL